MSSQMTITAFYKFIAVSDVQEMQQRLHAFGAEHSMTGLVLVAEEGVNGTVCGTPEVISQWKQLIERKFGEMVFKDSGAHKHVFRRWSVDIREEIVSLKQPGVHPAGAHKHLSPEEWNAMMEQEDVIILDTRNTYETDIGVFEKAIDPRLSTFQEFPDYVRKAGIPKEKKIMMYCTGGIRCEKALIEMEKQGYENVYQLEGGILAYLEKFPNAQFQGECFVFDHRVAVDQQLQPSSRYGLCPHCGNPGDLQIQCIDCSKACKVCVACSEKEGCKTCSRRCRSHYMQHNAVHS